MMSGGAVFVLLALALRLQPGAGIANEDKTREGGFAHSMIRVNNAAQGQQPGPEFALVKDSSFRHLCSGRHKVNNDLRRPGSDVDWIQFVNQSQIIGPGLHTTPGYTYS